MSEIALDVPDVALESLWRAVTDGTAADYYAWVEFLHSRQPDPSLRDDLVTQAVHALVGLVPQLVDARLAERFKDHGKMNADGSVNAVGITDMLLPPTPPMPGEAGERGIP